MLQSQEQTLQRSTASELQISRAACCAACMMLDACNSSFIYPWDYVIQENTWSSASGIARNFRGIQFLWIISLDRCIVPYTPSPPPSASVVNQTTALLHGNDALTMDFEIGPPLPTTCTTTIEPLNSSVCVSSWRCISQNVPWARQCSPRPFQHGSPLHVCLRYPYFFNVVYEMIDMVTDSAHYALNIFWGESCNCPCRSPILRISCTKCNGTLLRTLYMYVTCEVRLLTVYANTVYIVLPGKRPLQGKRPCTAFRAVNVAASI
jgi:hypothetical protein